MHLQRNATQRNATQRNAYQNYILLLTNNFKFYILQILGHLNFLSVFFRFAKNQFANLITRGFPKGRRANPLRAFAIAYNGLANGTHKRKPHCYSDFASNFEIISRNENYAFNHNNFYHNGNNRIWRLPRLLAKGTPTETKSRNDDFIVCNNGLLSLNNDLFSRNDYGGNFIFGFWSNFNFGFLFNRKINSKKILFQKEKKR